MTYLPRTERDKLRLLLQYSRKLAVFQKRATLVQECLEEVLSNGQSSYSFFHSHPSMSIQLIFPSLCPCLIASADDDLAAMYLTSKLEQKPRDAADHEEIELLLESFSKQCAEITSEVETLSVRYYCIVLSGSLATIAELRRRSARLVSTRPVTDALEPTGKRTKHRRHSGIDFRCEQKLSAWFGS